jgi:hypothetical protein
MRTQRRYYHPWKAWEGVDDAPAAAMPYTLRGVEVALSKKGEAAAAMFRSARLASSGLLKRRLSLESGMATQRHM